MLRSGQGALTGARRDSPIPPIPRTEGELGHPWRRIEDHCETAAGGVDVPSVLSKILNFGDLEDKLTAGCKLRT